MKKVLLFLSAFCLASAISAAATNCGGLFPAEQDGGGATVPNRPLFTQLQQVQGWASCKDASGCGGGDGLGACWIEMYQKQPSTSGASTAIFNAGSTQDCNTMPCKTSNSLFFKKLSAGSSITYNYINYVKFDYSIKLDPLAAANAQALEIDIFQFYCVSSNDCSPSTGNVNRFMMGTQCDLHNLNYSYPVWELWDSGDINPKTGKPGLWKDDYLGTGNAIKCVGLLDSAWHQVELIVTLDHTANQYTFVSLSVDRNTKPISQLYPAQTNSHDGGNFGVQFQLDSVPLNTQGFREWFDNVNVCTDPNQC